MWSYNTEIFQYLNELTRYELIATVTPKIADIPIFFLPLFLTSLWLFYTFSKYYARTERNELKEQLMYIFYSCVIVIIFSYLIKSQVNFVRPETAISEAGKLLMNKIPESSFPSDHASVSFAFLTALFLSHYKKVFWAFLPWVILMNFSRIIAWVHWPTDIIGWLMIGILAWYIWVKILPKIKFVKNVNSFIMKLLSYIKL